MALARERFESGLTYEQFVEGMTQNKERMLKNEQAVQLAADDIAFFKSRSVPINVLILAEDWCGDVIANLPIFGKLAQAAGGAFNVRIFKRDQNLDLMDQYLYQGQFRSIPAVVFFDDKMAELGRWWERPQIARDEMAEVRRRFSTEHAALPDAGKPFPEMSESTRQLYTAMMAKVRSENAARWTQALVDEIRAIVA